MKHFLITRFNLKQNKAAKPQQSFLGLNEHWLAQRLSLFTTFCAPAVTAQSNKNFEWLVLFDVDTPLSFKQTIELSAARFRFVPIFIDGFKGIDNELPQLLKNLAKDEDFMVTTRLDNDDIIHQDFIKEIQLLYRPTDGLVIDMPRGFQVGLSNNALIARNYMAPFNPFLTLVEKTVNAKSVLSREHHHWKNAKNIATSPKRLWIELVHGGNQTNRQKIYFPLTTNICLMKFQLDGYRLKHSQTKTIIYNFFSFPLCLGYQIRQKLMLWRKKTSVV